MASVEGPFFRYRDLKAERLVTGVLLQLPCHVVPGLTVNNRVRIYQLHAYAAAAAGRCF